MAGARLLGVLATALAPLHVVAHVRLDPVAGEVPPVRFEAEPPRWRLAGSGGGRIRVGAPPLPGFAPLPLGRGQLPPRRQRGLARDRPPLPGQVLDAAGARRQVEDAALRVENERLRDSEAVLRQEADRLRRDDTELRREDLELRRADSRLRGMVERLLPAADPGAAEASQRFAPFHLARHRVSMLDDGSRASKDRVILGVCLGGCSVVVLGMLLCLGAGSSPDPPDKSFNEDSSEDVLDDELNAFMARPQKRQRFCCGLCCCLSFDMAVFVLVVLLCTALGAYVLWTAGILQPILGQIAVYVYVSVVIIGFIYMMIWEVKRLARAVVRYIRDEFRKIKQGFKKPWSSLERGSIGERTKSCLLEDGPYSAFFPRGSTFPRGAKKAPAGH